MSLVNTFLTLTAVVSLTGCETIRTSGDYAKSRTTPDLQEPKCQGRNSRLSSNKKAPTENQEYFAQFVRGKTPEQIAAARARFEEVKFHELGYVTEALEANARARQPGTGR